MYDSLQFDSVIVNAKLCFQLIGKIIEIAQIDAVTGIITQLII